MNNMPLLTIISLSCLMTINIAHAGAALSAKNDIMLLLPKTKYNLVLKGQNRTQNIRTHGETWDWVNASIKINKITTVSGKKPKINTLDTINISDSHNACCWTTAGPISLPEGWWLNITVNNRSQGKICGIEAGDVNTHSKVDVTSLDSFTISSHDGTPDPHTHRGNCEKSDLEKTIRMTPST